VTLIIPPGFGNAALVFNSTQGTAPFVTTIGVDLSGYGGDFVLAANVVMLAFADAASTQVDGDLTLDRVTLSVGQDGPGGSVDSDTTPIPMTRSGNAGTYGMSIIARKVTNELGRRGRGRMFIPGMVTQTEVDADGSVTSTRRAQIETVLDDFYDNLADGFLTNPPLEPFLFHSSAPADPSPITGFVLSDLVGFLRGRIR